MDAAIFRFINISLSNPAFDTFFPWWTDVIRTDTFRFFLLPLILVTLFYVFRWRGIAVAAIASLFTWGVDVLNAVAMKPLFLRPRPFETISETILRTGKPGSSSFPSGHATDSFFLATFLAVLYPRLWPIYYLLAFLIGVSRIYVGVHYPADILGGALIGSLLGWLAARALLRLESSRTLRDPQ